LQAFQHVGKYSSVNSTAIRENDLDVRRMENVINVAANDSDFVESRDNDVTVTL